MILHTLRVSKIFIIKYMLFLHNHNQFIRKFTIISDLSEFRSSFTRAIINIEYRIVSFIFEIYSIKTVLLHIESNGGLLRLVVIC